MKQLIKIFILIWWLIFAIDAFSQEHKELCNAAKWNRIETRFKIKIQTCEKEAQKYKQTANYALIITISIGILGAVSALIQQVQSNWSKTVAMIAGGLVTALTIVNNSVFDGDHRAINKRATKIQAIIDQIYSRLEDDFNVENCDDFNKQRDDIQNLFGEIHKIQLGEDQPALPPLHVTSHPSPPTSPKPHLISLFVAESYAQEMKKNLPSWVLNPPQKKDKFYFVGFGIGQSLKEAEESSMSDGQEQVRDFFVQEFGRNRQAEQPAADTSKAIAAFLTNYIQMANKFFIYKPEEKSYSFYALISVEKDLAEDYLKLYAAQEGLTDVKPYSDIIQKTPNLPNDYQTRRNDKYEELAKKAKKEVPKGILADFERGRQLRKTGKIAEAIKILTAVTQKQPDFYLAWYNLALAYMATNDLEKTIDAFKTAVKYDQLQSLRDASLYNSYGWFLYRNKRYDEAVETFEKALAIDPNHPKAKNNLVAAKKASGR